MPIELLQEKLTSFFTHYPIQKYSKRSLILHANDDTKNVFYIKEGFIRIYRISEKGEELTLTILRPHDFFPLTYGMSARPNMFYVEALTILELWKAPQEPFAVFVKQNPAIYDEMTSQLLMRFDSMLSRMEHMVFSNASTKVKAMLLLCARRFAKQEGDAAILLVPLTHHDIATLVGITRETTSLEMKKLEHQGYITKRGKFLVIQNLQLLEKEIAENETTSLQFLYL